MMRVLLQLLLMLLVTTKSLKTPNQAAEAEARE
jgi:hypothetical protein